MKTETGKQIVQFKLRLLFRNLQVNLNNWRKLGGCFGQLPQDTLSYTRLVYYSFH